MTEREKDDLHGTLTTHRAVRLEETSNLHSASECTITDTSVPSDQYTDPGIHSFTDRNRIYLIRTIPKVISHIKHTVNSLLHLDERNKCCKSATTFSSVLFSLINVVRVSKRKP